MEAYKEYTTSLSKEEIVHGNMLIGEFWELNSGWAYHEDDDKEGFGHTKWHKSWDWMHQIIDKINKMGKEYSFAMFKSYSSLTVEKGGKMYKDFSYAYAEYYTAEQTPIEATFKLVVHFLTWVKAQEKNLVVSK